MADKLKILLILPQAQQGGAETQLLNLLRHLDTSVFDLTLGMLYSNNQLEKEFRDIPHLRIIHFEKKGGADFFIYFRIISYMKKNRIDIIQTFLGNHHAYIPAMFYPEASCICGIRATSCRKSFSINLTRFILPRLIMKFREIIFVSNSEEGKKIYVDNRIKQDNVLVIPNGIDTERFEKGSGKKIIKEFGLEHKLVLGIVARLVDSKNHAFLLKLMKELKPQFNNLKLVIVGEGEHRDALKDMADNLGVTEDVIFAGNRKDIPDILNAMDIFVFPSLFPEGWPNAVGEAMCAGLPVIAFDIGDINRIIHNNVDGIVTGQNSELFKEELVKLIKDKKKRKILGKNAKKSILENYTIRRMVNSYESLYLKLKQPGDCNRNN